MTAFYLSMSNQLQTVENRLQALMDAIQKELAKLAEQKESLPYDAVRKALSRAPGAQRGDLAELVKSEPRLVGRVLEAMRMRGEALCIGQRRGARWFLASHLDQLTKPH